MATNIIVLIGVVAVLSTIDFWIILIALSIIFVNTVSTAVQKKQEIDVNNDFVPINRKTAYFLIRAPMHPSTKRYAYII